MGIPLEDITPAECLDELLKILTSRPFGKTKTAPEKGRYAGHGIAPISATGSAGSIV
jgi:carbon-monoxide dehydrogenase large subunit